MQRHRRRPRVERQGEAEPRLLGDGCVKLGDLLNQVGGGDRLQAIARHRLRAADLDRGGQHPHHQIGLGEQSTQRRLASGGVGERRLLGTGTQPRQRRAEVVGQAVRDDAQFAHQRLDLLQHRVEPRRESIERVTPGGERAHAPRQVALPRRIDHRGDAIEPPPDEPCEHQPRGDAQRQRQEHRDQQRAFHRALLGGEEIQGAPRQQPVAADRHQGVARLTRIAAGGERGDAERGRAERHRQGRGRIPGDAAAVWIDDRQHQRLVPRPLRILDRIAHRDDAARPPHAGERVRLLGGLTPHRVERVRPGLLPHRADQRQVGDEREPDREQRDPGGDRQPQQPPHGAADSR